MGINSSLAAYDIAWGPSATALIRRRFIGQQVVQHAVQHLDTGLW